VSAPVTPLAGAYQADARGWTELLGWRYPAAFSDPVAEHHAVRRAAGVFDLSFMTHVAASGPGAPAFVQRLITNDAARLAPGRMLYSPICDEMGGMVDDCMVIRHGGDWVVTAGLRSTAAWIATQAQRFDVALDDRSSRLAVVAVQGPASAQVLAALGLGDVAALGYHAAAGGSLDGVPLLLARLGYTGELGFELFAPGAEAPTLWRRLVALARPCGALALDTLRIEAGLLLSGVDFDRGVTPYEVGLERFVRLDTDDFTGRAALAGHGRPARRLAGLRLAAGAAPRRGARVVDGAGAAVGVVTSACLAPTLGMPLALAGLAAHAIAPLTVDGAAAEAVSLPFYDPERRRSRARPAAPTATVA
jgi:aminomethyltransferase